jgi:serine phosphatase RsbU (regulator of sigma subunit)
MADGTSGKYLQCMEVWGGNAPIDTSVVLPGLDAWVYARPFAGEAEGGDVHYVSSCASGVVSRLLVADVSGHGMAVAETARHLRGLMRRYVNRHDQVGFVRAMNRHFGILAQAGTFATAVVATYEGPLRRLLLTNAGHPPPLIYRQSERRWSFLDAESCAPGGSEAVVATASVTNLPLGIENVVDYEQFHVELETGDLILCYTDALAEARKDGRMLGNDGLLRAVGETSPDPPPQFIPRLVEWIATRGWDIQDDLTLLLFRPNGTRPYVPLHDRLLAPFRAVRAIGMSYWEV